MKATPERNLSEQEPDSLAQNLANYVLSGVAFHGEAARTFSDPDALRYHLHFIKAEVQQTHPGDIVETSERIAKLEALADLLERSSSAGTSAYCPADGQGTGLRQYARQAGSTAGHSARAGDTS